MANLPSKERILNTVIFPKNYFIILSYYLYLHVCFEYVLRLIVIIRSGEEKEMGSLIWRNNSQVGPHSEVFILTTTNWNLILEILVNYIAFWHSLETLNLSLGASNSAIERVFFFTCLEREKQHLRINSI